MMTCIHVEAELTCISLFLLPNEQRPQYPVEQHGGSAWGPSVCLDVKKYFYFHTTCERSMKQRAEKDAAPS